MNLVKNRVVRSPYPDVEIPTCSLYEFLAAAMKKHGNKIAYVEGTRTTSYDGLLKAVRRYAEGFRQHGVQHGDSIIVTANTTTDSVIAVLSILMSGCVACFPCGPGTHKEFVYHVKSTKAKFCLADVDSLQMIMDVAKDCNFQKVFTTTEKPGFVSLSSFNHLPEMALEGVREADTRKALSAIAFTSGTTDNPKGVMISQYSLIGSILNLGAMKGVLVDDVSLNLWPLFMIASARVFMTFISLGCTTVLLNPRCGSHNLMEDIRRYKVTTLCGSAITLERLAAYAYRLGEKMPTVRRTCSVGGSLLQSTVDNMRTVFDLVTLAHAYGLTEAASAVLVPPIDILGVPFLGYPGLNVLVKVVDVTTREALPEGENGEICVKLPTVMMGYLNDEEATREVLSHDGWLLTGDCGHYDKDGRLYFIDRMKDTIKCLGIHVPTAELEQQIKQVPEVGEVAVVGVPIPELQDAPIAFVVLKETATPSDTLAQKIKRFVSERCPQHMRLHGGVAFIKSLPKSPTGKVLKRELRVKAMDPATVKL
ncbi:uncharacterized protein LOC144169702 [Haemaphysalis longicornis]